MTKQRERERERERGRERERRREPFYAVLLLVKARRNSGKHGHWLAFPS
jgi:hypothetical protein